MYAEIDISIENSCFYQGTKRQILRQPCPQRFSLIERLSRRARLTSILSSRLIDLHRDDTGAGFECLKNEIAAAHAEWDSIYAELKKHREEHGC